MLVELLGLELSAGLQSQRNHACAPIGMRHLNTVNNSLSHAGKCLGDTFELGGRDVLSFPTEGVAYAVNKRDMSVPLVFDKIASVEPAITQG